MGKLVDGRWVASREQTRIGGRGEFIRGVTKFRDWVRADGTTPFLPEAGRYHLLVAYNCPWAHRTIIARNLKGLNEAIGMTVAHYRRNEDGWWFPEGVDEFEPADGRLPLHVFYGAANPHYSGSATVPVLWDKHHRTIVSNESGEIIRMLNGEFPGIANDDRDLYPAPLRDEIDSINERIYRDINNGVYKCGFARTQEAYEQAFRALFAALDDVDRRLEGQRYLVGESITLADIRLFTTLVRFDAVYHSHFKCNLRRIADYPNLWGYVRDLYQTSGFGETVRIDIYKKGYYGRSARLNPTGIIPMGPATDFTAPHDRAGSTEASA